MFCLESWAFNIMTLFAAFISIKATSVQVITLNVLILIYSPFVGFQTAGSVIIGNCIGAMHVKLAKMYQKIIQLIGFLLSLMIGITVFIFSEFIARYYTNLEDL